MKTRKVILALTAICVCLQLMACSADNTTIVAATGETRPQSTQSITEKNINLNAENEQLRSEIIALQLRVKDLETTLAANPERDQLNALGNYFTDSIRQIYSKGNKLEMFPAKILSAKPDPVDNQGSYIITVDKLIINPKFTIGCTSDEPYLINPDSNIDNLRVRKNTVVQDENTLYIQIAPEWIDRINTSGGEEYFFYIENNSAMFIDIINVP